MSILIIEYKLIVSRINNIVINNTIVRNRQVLHKSLRLILGLA